MLAERSQNPAPPPPPRAAPVHVHRITGQARVSLIHFSRMGPH